jgi:cold-inducible RNA-binding protein
LAISHSARLNKNCEPCFETHGAVERVNIVTDKETGRPPGFAFVEMTNAGEADKASAAITGSSLAGRALKVSEARKKASRAQRMRRPSDF